MININGLWLVAGAAIPSLLAAYSKFPREYKLNRFSFSFLLSLSIVTLTSIELNVCCLQTTITFLSALKISIIQALFFHLGFIVVLVFFFQVSASKISNNPKRIFAIVSILIFAVITSAHAVLIHNYIR